MSSKTIVLASNNAKKIHEFNQLFASLDIKVIAQSEYGVSEIEETGHSFIENAILKARHAAQQTGLPALADDSGIEVDALQGSPGIYSARYAGAGASDEANWRKVLNQLESVADAQRQARFQCLLVLMRHGADPTPLVCQGTWEGHILREPRGQNGFGYDPVFLVPTEGKSAAELPAELKNTLSHRGQALRNLLEQLTKMPHWLGACRT